MTLRPSQSSSTGNVTITVARDPDHACYTWRVSGPGVSEKGEAFTEARAWQEAREAAKEKRP